MFLITNTEIYNLNNLSKIWIYYDSYSSGMKMELRAVEPHDEGEYFRIFSLNIADKETAYFVGNKLISAIFDAMSKGKKTFDLNKWEDETFE